MSSITRVHKACTRLSPHFQFCQGSPHKPTSEVLRVHVAQVHANGSIAWQVMHKSTWRLEQIKTGIKIMPAQNVVATEQCQGIIVFQMRPCLTIIFCNYCRLNSDTDVAPTLLWRIAMLIWTQPRPSRRRVFTTHKLCVVNTHLRYLTCNTCQQSRRWIYNCALHIHQGAFVSCLDCKILVWNGVAACSMLSFKPSSLSKLHKQTRHYTLLHLYAKSWFLELTLHRSTINSWQSIISRRKWLTWEASMQGSSAPSSKTGTLFCTSQSSARQRNHGPTTDVQ